MAKSKYLANLEGKMMARIVKIALPHVDGLQYVATFHVYEALGKDTFTTVDILRCDHKTRCLKGTHCTGVCVAVSSGPLLTALRKEALELLPVHEVMNS